MATYQWGGLCSRRTGQHQRSFRNFADGDLNDPLKNGASINADYVANRENASILSMEIWKELKIKRG